MRRSLRLAPLLLLSLLAILLLPTIAAAQQVARETVTIQINGRTPAGTSVIGVVVARRSCGATVESEVTFNGMINGLPAAFSGKVIEHWLGDGKEEVEVISTDLAGLVVAKLPVRKILVAQAGANLVTVEGLPVAIDGVLEPPCGGRTSYTATNAGQGVRTILTLPNTASNTDVEGPQYELFQPLMVAGLLVGAGILLILASRLLRERPSAPAPWEYKR
jgi:uncharacterized Zn-binding protein involved in type VI secretion